MKAVTRRKEGYVNIITLERPPINGLDLQSLREISEAVESAKNDYDCRVLVIASGLEGIFCSGGDLRFWKDIQDGKSVSNAGAQVFEQIELFPKPTIATINGHVIGDGISLAFACDLRIASESASFRMPEASYGFIPGWGSVRRIISIAGRGVASSMLLTGKQITAARAQIVGLVNETVPSEEVMKSTLETATRVSKFSPASVRAIKCALLGGDESRCFEAVWGKDDWKEGISALMQKRNPVFLNKGSFPDCCSIFTQNFESKK